MAFFTPLSVNLGMIQTLQPGIRLAQSLVSVGGALQTLRSTGLPLDTSPRWNAATWAAIRSALSMCNATTTKGTVNVFQTPVTVSAGTPSVFSGGVLAPNGCIYCIPSGSTVTGVGKITPTAGGGATFSFPAGLAIAGGGWGSGGVLAPYNGLIYAVGYSSGKVLKIDWTTDTLSTVTQTGSYVGAVLSPTDGCIYAQPGASGTTTLLKLNPNGDVMSTFGATTYGYYSRGCLAPNGNIYYPPSSGATTSIGVVTPGASPSFNVAVTGLTGLATGSNYWMGAVLAPNGCIYCPPNNAGRALKINTNNNTWSLFGDFFTTGGALYTGGALAPDGKIYCLSSNSAQTMIIDPTTDTTLELAGAGNHSTIMAANGYVYGVPMNTRTVVSWSTGFSDVPLNVYCSPFFNHS